MSEKTGKIGVREALSALWIVVMFNMAFADILSFILPGGMEEISKGSAGGIAITQPLLLIFAFLIEIPIAMIFLSRLLARKPNRILNVAAAAVTALFVVGGGSLSLHYLFFAGIEVACMAAIAVISLRWKAESAA